MRFNIPAAASLLIFLAPMSLATVTIEENRIEEGYRSDRTDREGFHITEELGIKNPFGWRSKVIYGGLGLVAGYLAFRLGHKLTRGKQSKIPVMPLAIALVLVTGLPGAACINLEEQPLDGTYENFTDAGWFTETVRNAMQAKAGDDPHLKPNPKAYAKAPAPGVLESDEAARMIIRGDAAGALEKLRAIEAAHPGLYAVAANMGTAFELTGDNESALKWILEGIRRNPKSHMLAEWLHAKILEAKIAMVKDPAWLDANTITGFNPADKKFATIQGSRSRGSILNSIRSQATVRALFIKPQDVIMAHLLLEAAAFAVEEQPGTTLGALDLAEEYGLPHEKTGSIRERFSKKLRIAGSSEARLWLYRWGNWLIFGLAMVIGAGLAAIKRSGKKRVAKLS